MYAFNPHHRMPLLLSLTVVALLVACSGQKPVHVKQDIETALTWPQPPNKPRIKYIGSLSTPKDLGMRKGFLDFLSEVALGKEENGMVLPMAVVENNKKQLFVADPGVKAIHRFDRESGIYRTIKRAGEKDFESPVGLAADSEGNVYVADSELAKVYFIGVDKNEATAIAFEEDFIRPTGVAVDKKNGWIYVVDTGSHSISVFNSNMSMIRKIGHRGSAAGEFNYPTYIWQNNDGEILVTDSLNFRIQRFDRHGKYLGQFGKAGNAMGDLSRPKGVAEDSLGHIYVVDSLFHNVQLFDLSGSLLMHFGRQGNEPGEFWLPVGIFISDDNTIYLCDSYNQRVQIFRYMDIDQ